ncbi:Hypp7458 [Branchiostoma lanceolatum]|uniref:Hypp7458 protein n=1 Tax=Branchiostoma lanceolatum TaxID=7740 RepID=A0A8J9Z0H6_BRALA|nr:Hypp7458 [Branchiostoma lanceolatum]
MSAACNLLTTFPLWWTHLVAFASGGAVFAAVFYFSGGLFTRVSPAFRCLDTKKQAEVRLHAAVGLTAGIISMSACYVILFGHLSLDMISKDVPIVRHTSAFDLGVLLAELVISVSVPLTGPCTVGTFRTASHHVLVVFGEIMSLVHGVVPYVVIFHHRMDLTAPPFRLRLILKTLGVSREAPGYLPLWVGSLTLTLYIRVLVLPLYWHNFAFFILPQMDEIKRW